MQINESVQGIQSEMTEWRRHLHAHPELGFEEHATAHFIAERLRGWGIDTVTGIAGTGVVGTLRGALGPGDAITIRADMDALPMTELQDHPYASRHPGRMHACGHDGHVAMLLGAARCLALQPKFKGTVHFVFQPAEEGLGGAKAMLEEGLFTRFPADEVYALHNSERPFGQVVIYDGAVAASADQFEIAITGRGGHAATPHFAIDPIPIAARLILALEAIPGREIEAAKPAVVSVTQMRAGRTFNVIPEQAVIAGTVRTFDPEVRDRLEAAIRRTANGLAAAFGATATCSYNRIFPPTINSAPQADFMASVADDVVGDENVLRNPPPEMGSEDFSYMLQVKPGCYFLLGQGDTGHQACAHDPRYDFNDALLSIGASLWVRLVERRLRVA
ncbi:M20 aminoacylase family protein [Dongia deserti]|uniref:M20 aminoacylase family protein n=1 Tax=Dongia deserti TaxID=2268030 RepID=UPI000E64CD82|nr:M20 aminoacylase family protein [Dongia deserti]